MAGALMGGSQPLSVTHVSPRYSNIYTARLQTVNMRCDLRHPFPCPRSYHHPPTLEDVKTIASAEITRDLFTAGAQADWFFYSHLGNCTDHVAVSAPKTRRTAGTPDPMPNHHARYPGGADAGPRLGRRDCAKPPLYCGPGASGLGIGR